MYGSPTVVKLKGPKYEDLILPVLVALTFILEGSVMGFPFSPLYAKQIYSYELRFFLISMLSSPNPKGTGDENNPNLYF